MGCHTAGESGTVCVYLRSQRFFEVDETIGSSELRCVLVGSVTYVPVNFKM